MPRSIQDILEHADELAARFENYEPDDERPVEEYLESPWVCCRLVLLNSNPGRGGLLVSVER